jgi:GTPase SAR1 family protein
LFQPANIDSLSKLKSMDAFAVVYSLDNRNSFDEASEWYKKLDRSFSDVPILLCANKFDLSYSREVDPEEGKEVKKIGRGLEYKHSVFTLISSRPGLRLK